MLNKVHWRNIFPILIGFSFDDLDRNWYIIANSHSPMPKFISLRKPSRPTLH
uniref:Uncharacterized protein n=1 Tax=Nelumbo nucifera TaxID=4432 RepID=A0A822YC18_NELNU|nr:TPA_asm: hypothetical protein HUJ06_030529 [Nelumbo nucifera]